MHNFQFPICYVQFPGKISGLLLKVSVSYVELVVHWVKHLQSFLCRRLIWLPVDQKKNQADNDQCLDQ